jgi:hypothetical protein|nr:MAG TPA: hypothetical protein [Caudoviricetes sp.]
MNNKNDFKDDVWCGIKRERQEKIKKVKLKKDNYNTINRMLIIINNFIRLLLLINLLVISSKFL